MKMKSASFEMTPPGSRCALADKCQERGEALLREMVAPIHRFHELWAVTYFLDNLHRLVDAGFAGG